MNWFKKMIRNFLEIDEANTINSLKVESLTTHDTETFINKIWYRGSGYELEQLYNQVKDISGNVKFWGNKNARIRKIHTGLPSMIIDTLADIVVDNLNIIKVEKRQEEWEDIARENNFKEMLKRAVIDVLWGGDGAFKVSIDTNISENPIIEFYSADRVDYVLNRGRIQGVVFKTNKIINDKKYLLKEIYENDKIHFVLLDEDDKEVSLEILGDKKQYLPIINKGNFLMAKRFMIRPSYKYEGRGKSVLSGKLDNFDAFDEVWSQWMLAIRKGQIKTYIPENLIPRDGRNGSLLKANDFETDFVSLEADLTEGRTNQIQTTQGNIQYEALINTYITALDQCLTGVISPSTLGIDTKKLDNAEAQREKEKTTLYKVNQIIDSLKEVIADVVDITFKVKDSLSGGNLEDAKVEVIFTSYANPSFEAQVETIGKANTTQIMSVETQVDQLWGDNKDEDWKIEETKRIKQERGIEEEAEPAINKDNIEIKENELEEKAKANEKAKSNNKDEKEVEEVEETENKEKVKQKQNEQEDKQEKEEK